MLKRVIVITDPDQADAIFVRALEALKREFPTVDISVEPPTTKTFAYFVRTSEWDSPVFDLSEFDRSLDGLATKAASTLYILGPTEQVLRTTLEVLTRLQRFLHRRNQFSSSPLFDAILERHRSLYNPRLPLALADYEHALDTWQWVLRIEPFARLPVQLAALFHDIERLESESTERIEHRAPDYQAYKNAHAETGAQMTRQILSDLTLESSIIDQTTELVRDHERLLEKPELLLLNDADGLSFFSLNSAGFINYFGPDHTQNKIAYTLARIRPDQQKRLAHIRYSPPFAKLLATVLGSSPRNANPTLVASSKGFSHR